MHFFRVEVEGKKGRRKTLLVVAKRAVDAYQLVANGDTVVHEVSRQSGPLVVPRHLLVDANSAAAPI